jgi:hypothetical protein
MPTSIERAREMLQTAGARPRMYALSKEAFVMRATTVLEVFIDGFNAMEFYERHLERYGSSLKGLSDPVEDKWGQSVMADALKVLGNG